MTNQGDIIEVDTNGDGFIILKETIILIKNYLKSSKFGLSKEKILEAKCNYKNKEYIDELFNNLREARKEKIRNTKEKKALKK